MQASKAWIPERLGNKIALTYESGQDFYFCRNLPIRWARIVGIVVAVDEFAGRRAFTIDDSSGVCMEAITAYTPPPKAQDPGEATKDVGAHAQPTVLPHGQPSKHDGGKQSVETQHSLPYEEIDVGAVVDVKGRLTTFRDEMQIKIEKMVSLKSTAQEITLWEKRAKFRRDVLDPPWVLRDKEVRRCRKEAERSEEEAERKKKRIKAAVDRAASRQTERPMQTPKENTSTGHAADMGAIKRNGIKGKYNALGI